MRTHLAIMGVMILVILAFASFNSYEEQLPSFSFFVGTVLGAVAAPILGMAGFIIASRIMKTPCMPFCVVAYLMCAMGLFIYFIYVCNGKADNMDTAAHMHVIVFPIFHSFVTLVLLIIASMICLGQWIWKNRLKKESPNIDRQRDASKRRAPAVGR